MAARGRVAQRSRTSINRKPPIGYIPRHRGSGELTALSCAVIEQVLRFGRALFSVARLCHVDRPWWLLKCVGTPRAKVDRVHCS